MPTGRELCFEGQAIGAKSVAQLSRMKSFITACVGMLLSQRFVCFTVHLGQVVILVV